MGSCVGKLRARRAVLAASALLCASWPARPLPAADQTPDRPNDAVAEAADAELFLGQVLPVFRQRCFGCHGDGDSLEGSLDLRTREGLLRGGDSGPALVPGKPDDSPLFTAVLRTGDREMPPKESNKLAPREIDALRKWIEAGAPWIDAADSHAGQPGGTDWNAADHPDGVALATSGGLSPEWTNRRYDPADVWAYRSVRRYPVPWDANGVDSLRESTAPAADSPLAERVDSIHPIDAFIRQQLRDASLTPAPPADPLTLLRRLTFDLTGLPPTPADTAAFLEDPSPEAYRALVERLLRSPHYGERMAQHWLDVVRYADTAGFSNDFERPAAWRYRDYVVRSFGADKPFDRFIVEQLAGDELDPDDLEMLIAVGFLRMGPWEHTGMSVAAVTRQQFLDDVTNHVGVTFLAQGLRCAQCHDHKFDPVPTRDYYRMQAVFAPVQFVDREVPYLPEENTSGSETRRARTQALLDDARGVLADLRKKRNQAVAALLRARGVRSVDELPASERPQRHYGLSPLDMSLDKISRKRVDYFERELLRYQPYAFSVYSGPLRMLQSNRPLHPLPTADERNGAAEDVFILTGGSLEAPAEKVGPGVLSAVAGSNDGAAPAAWNTIPETTHGRRLALAQWIASPSHTLTARVIVNRVWQMHFGTGLVETPNNFGKMGGRPSHPELLDWLATWFVEHGWSIRRLHRLIVTSETYRQSGEHPDFERVNEIDSRNRLLAYFPPRRLTAEELRDAMLAVTGELNLEMGGPGVFPEIHWEVARQPRHIMGSVAPAYQPSPAPAERNRRTLYAFRYRTLPDPLLEVFNQPGSETSCEQRDETTVTPQVFALFNGQFAHDRALALADRLMKAADEPQERVAQAFRLVYGRDPADDERAACLAHVAEMTAHHRRHAPAERPLPTSIRREMVEELTGETFEWTEELDLLKNGYVRDLQPWQVDAETRALAELCLVLLNSNEFVYVR